MKHLTMVVMSICILSAVSRMAQPQSKKVYVPRDIVAFFQAVDQAWTSHSNHMLEQAFVRGSTPDARISGLSGVDSHDVHDYLAYQDTSTCKSYKTEIISCVLFGNNATILSHNILTFIGEKGYQGAGELLRRDMTETDIFLRSHGHWKLKYVRFKTEVLRRPNGEVLP